MSIYYQHLLIPAEPNFMPQPEQVALFLSRLVELRSAALHPQFELGRHFGKIRVGKNPMTGEKITLAQREFAPLPGMDDVRRRLQELADYDLVMRGSGPAEAPPILLYEIVSSKEREYRGEYSYELRCCLRNEIVSTSSEGPEPGAPCSNYKQHGVFHVPSTGKAVSVPNAGCARFWIQFEFGKFLYPRSGQGIPEIRPDILTLATATFGVKFAEGCRLV